MLLQFSQHLGYRAMTHAKAAYAKLVERAHRGQIANASGAFNIDSAFKLVGDDPDFFYRGAGGRPAGRGFDPLHPHLYGNITHAANLLLIEIVRFKDHFGRNRRGGFHHAAQIFADIVIIAGEHFADIHHHIYFTGAVGNQLPHFLYLGIGGMPAAGKVDRPANHAVTLLVAEEIPTGNALIYVAGNDAENMIAVDPGANMTVTDDEIAGCIPAIGCADVVLVQLENNLSAIEQVVDAGKQAGALVMLNPAPWQPVERALLSKVDLLTPNATEAGLMTGRRVDSLAAAAEAADVLHAQGARNVIITLGASGALLSEQGVKSPIPCFPSHPRDTTGAGDAFNGALAARLACGEPLQAAARFAAAYAAVSVEKQGASSLPEYLEAQERLLRAAADYEMA